jgi:hypothetical protein
MLRGDYFAHPENFFDTRKILRQTRAAPKTSFLFVDFS